MHARVHARVRVWVLTCMRTPWVAPGAGIKLVDAFWHCLRVTYGSPTGILINMARGPVVDTAALCEALKDRIIAAAALDVTDPEPLPRNHPLLKFDNVIIAPHLGSASNRTRRRMMEMTIENLNAGLEGRDLPYRIRC